MRWDHVPPTTFTNIKSTINIAWKTCGPRTTATVAIFQKTSPPRSAASMLAKFDSGFASSTSGLPTSSTSRNSQRPTKHPHLTIS